MIIATLGLKGGVGKTTLAINVAAEFLARGKKVLLVDGDPQQTARTWFDVAVEAGRAVPTVVTMGANLHQPGQLDRVRRGFDVVVVDCPPRIDAVQRSALMVADVALLPCGPSPADLWALASSVELVTQARIVRPHLRAAVVMNKLTATKLARATQATLSASAGLPILATTLSNRVAYAESLAAGQGVTTYSPSDAAAAEMRNLVDEILKLAEGTHEQTTSGTVAA